jgi:hypothetical protein
MKGSKGSPDGNHHYAQEATTTMENEMNATSMSQEVKVDKSGTDTQAAEASIAEKNSDAMNRAFTASQRAAICFAAGVIGAMAVVICSYALFGLGISGALGVKGPLPLKSPDIYKPLFWGGLWGILFGLFAKTAWKRLYLFGFLYVLAPLAALFLFFLPKGGMGYFGLNQGPAFTLYLLLVNLPFGIVTALAARAVMGKNP